MSSRATLWRDVKEDFGGLAASPKVNSAEDHLSMPMLSAHRRRSCCPWGTDSPPKVNKSEAQVLSLRQSDPWPPFLLPTADPLPLLFILSASLLPCLWLPHGWALNVEACSWASRIIPQPCLRGPIPSPAPFPLEDFMDYYFSVNIDEFSKDPKKQPIRYSPIIQENTNLNKYSLNQSLYTCADTSTRMYHIGVICCHQNHRKKAS